MVFIRNWYSKTVRKYRKKEEEKTITDTHKLKF